MRPAALVRQLRISGECVVEHASRTTAHGRVLRMAARLHDELVRAGLGQAWQHCSAIWSLRWLGIGQSVGHPFRLRVHVTPRAETGHHARCSSLVVNSNVLGPACGGRWLGTMFEFHVG